MHIGLHPSIWKDSPSYRNGNLSGLTWSPNINALEIFGKGSNFCRFLHWHIGTKLNFLESGYLDKKMQIKKDQINWSLIKRNILFFFYSLSNVELSVESVNSSTDINQLLFASEEWVALGAYFNFQFVLDGSRHECVSTCTLNNSFRVVFWMYAFFHLIHLNFLFFNSSILSLTLISVKNIMDNEEGRCYN